jgi:hypothetical protein
MAAENMRPVSGRAREEGEVFPDVPDEAGEAVGEAGGEAGGEDGGEDEGDTPVFHFQSRSDPMFLHDSQNTV